MIKLLYTVQIPDASHAVHRQQTTNFMFDVHRKQLDDNGSIMVHFVFMTLF